MTKTDAFLNRMTELLEQRCLECLKEAEFRADEILSKAKMQSEEQLCEALENARAKAENLKRRVKTQVKEEATDQILLLRETLVEETLAAISDSIEEIVNGPDFPHVLVTLIEETLHQIEGKAIVKVPQLHLDYCRQWLDKRNYPHVSLDPISEMRDGVIIEDPDHTFRITNTLSGRLEKSVGDIRMLCIKKFFSEETN